MARKTTSAGGFYSYISHGLGREIGIGTGYGAVVAYSVFEASLAGGFAYFLSLKLNAYGVSIAWPWLALGMVAIIAILTYFDVRISSWVLAVGLISEIGIRLFFAFWSWVGFEMAPNYGEESRDPKRNVPRALYISVIGLGIFYTLTSWAALSGYPSQNAAVSAADSNAANFFFVPSTQYAGHWVTSVMSYLIITGSF